MSTSADSHSMNRMDRRDAIRWMVTAATTAAVLDPFTFAAEPGVVVAKGYGTDPDLLKTYQPGEVWRLTFNDEQRAIAIALCDTIIPSDAGGPAASRVKVHDFIDEWISAPYPGHELDRKVILDGLAWIDAEAQTRFGAGFVNLVARQRNRSEEHTSELQSH